MTYYKYLRDSMPIRAKPSQHHNLSLPLFIPILKTGMPRETKFDAKRLYGVYLQSVLDRYGNFKYKTADTLRHGLRLPPTGRLALFVTAIDKLIERAWQFSEDRDLWKRIAALKFEFVTSATFSVYEDDPRSDQIYNQERNFRTYDLFSDLGVPTIPFLFFNPNSNLDYDNIVRWLVMRRDVTKVAVLAHCYRHRKAFQRVLMQTTSIANEIRRPLEFVFVGVASKHKVRRVLLEYPKATFVTAQPVIKGMKGQRTQAGMGHIRVSSKDAGSAELIVSNIEQFDYDIEFERNRVNREGAHQPNLPFDAPAPHSPRF